LLHGGTPWWKSPRQPRRFQHNRMRCVPVMLR
jgi:hypothetical protein